MSDLRARPIARLVLALLAVCAAMATPARAHDARPVSVELRELAQDRFSVRVRAPESLAWDNQPRIVMPGNCSTLRIEQDEVPNLPSAALYACPGGITGKPIGIAFPIYNPSLSTLIQLERTGTERVSALLPPGVDSWPVPDAANRGDVLRDYLALGIRHIMGGIDHLLFVAGLLIIAGTLRRSLVVVTGFTVAHSITLGASALDLVRLPAPPVEAAIALSIVYLAVEIYREDKQSLTWRKPVLAAGLFGLLHGFGFASVLREVGVPAGDTWAALLAFNLGVEIGQIAFVVGLALIFAGAIRLLRGRDFNVVGWQRPASWLLGTTGAFWLFSRLAGFA